MRATDDPVEPNPLICKLARLVALSDVDQTILERISAGTRLLGARTDLIREGDTPDGVFLIMQGMACRHKLHRSGVRQITAYLLPGDFSDIDAALLKTMDHTISTLSVCKVACVPLETINDLMLNHPQIARALRKSMLVAEATSREWLISTGCRSAVERIAHLFCELLVRLGAVGRVKDNSFEFPLTQAELASTLGLSNVHMNRSLQDLRRQGLIELKGRRLRLINLKRLKIIADFRSNYLHLSD